MTVLETWIEPRPVKLTATDFLQLAAAGALRDYPKTELIDGVIVAMSPQHSTHARVHSLIFRRLAQAVEDVLSGFETWVEISIKVSREQVPQSDIAVTNYLGPRDAIPASTVALVVEIADTTAAFDRGKKGCIYASAGIPEYWVVDIQAAEVARFWAAGPDGYSCSDTVNFGKRVEAATLPGVAVETSGI